MIRFYQIIIISLILLTGLQAVIAQSVPNKAIYFKSIPPIEGEIPEWVQLMYSDNPQVSEVDRLYQGFYKENEFVKSTHTQNYKFWRKLLNDQQLIKDDGYIRIPSDTEILEQERQSANIYLAAQNSERALPWTPVGPMVTKATDGQPNVSWQTNVYTFDQAISNPNKVYAGTETGAMFTSTDKGLNWINIGAEISDGAIQSVVVDPTNDQIAYFGTNNNIWKTTDGGTTINSIYFQNSLSPRDFYINPSNTNIVLTATNVGVFRSINGGTTWTQLYTEDGWDLEGKPGTPNTVYLLMTKSSEQHIKFYRSTDAGASFTEQDSGWFAGSSTGINNSNNGARMGVTPADPNRIYVALLGNDVSYAEDNNFIGVYKSTDGGTSWSLPVGEVGGPYDANHLCLSSFSPASPSGYDQGYYNLGIAVSATNADSLLVGCLNLFQSTDGAATYTQWGGYGGGPGWQHPDIQEIEINGSDVWVASDGGLNYYTADWTSHESRANGINGSDYWGFDSGWNVDILVGGRYHNGNAAHIESYSSGQFLRLGGAESGTGYVNKGENRKVWHSDIGGDLVPTNIVDPVVGIANLGLYPNEAYYNENKSDLKTFPYCYNHFLLGKDNTLWKSENGGASFYSLHAFGASDQPLVGIEISRSNPDVIYVGQKISGSTLLWKTSDGGLNWSSTTVPGAVGGGLFLTLSPTDENILWVAHSKNGNTNKVLKTINGGVTWTDLTTSTLNGLYPEDILVQGGTDGGVYLSTHLAMYYRNNSHSDWQLYNDGLPAKFGVMEMRPFYRDSKLRAASNRGIWEVDFYESSTPVVQPTVDKLASTCPLDTFYFEDFSMLDHTGASWAWSFSPAPIYTSGTNIRKPKVIFGAEGTYSYTLTVNSPNGSDSKTYTDFIQITANECGIDSIPGAALLCTTSGDYVQTPDLEIGSTNTLTLMAWVKPNGIQAEYTGIVFNDGDSAGFNFLSGGTNNLGYHWPGGAWWWNSGLVVAADEWSHVAMVVDPTGVTVYVNGIPSKHSFSTGLADISTIKIGSYKGWSSRNYKGLIDEVMIWDKALTQEEIREHRHLTHDILQDPSLYAYYQFNESLNTIYDKTGNRHASFSGGSARTVSTAPVGGGTVERLSVSNAGNYVFGNTGVEIGFPSTGTYPDGELVAFQLHVAPDESPTGTSIPEEAYYIINNYGNNSSFTELESIRFGATEVSPLDAVNYNNLGLFKRPSNADGMTWGTAIDQADSATAGSNGSIRFDAGNTITEFSQFIIQKDNCPDSLLVNVQPIDGDTLQAALVVVSNGQELAGSNLVFHAGNCIRLDAGFTVDSGAEFLAEIANCTTTTTLIANESPNSAPVITKAAVVLSPQNQILTYSLSEKGRYSLYLQAVALGKSNVLFKNRPLASGQHQIALEKAQFPKGLYLLVLEKDGIVMGKELLAW